MKKLLLLFLLLFAVTANAQPNIAWQRCYGNTGGYIGGIDTTADGNIIFAGGVSYNGGDVTCVPDYDVWIVCINPITDSILWQKCYGGSDNDWPFAMHTTRDKGFIVLCQTESNDGDVIGNYCAQD